LKTDRRFGAGWNKKKIIVGKPLGYAAARRDNPALVSAAEAYFGTWGNALYAAGFDPNLYLRGKWRKRRMIAKRDHTRYGTYLARQCPRCNGYLGIVLDEPGRNTTLRAINGQCVQCGCWLAWTLITGKKRRGNHARLRKRYAGPTKNA
jgi:hypothetical protein